MALLKSVLTPDHVWNAVPEYDKPPETARTIARRSRVAVVEAGYRLEERVNSAINEDVKAKYGALSRPEPKSIHDPAPRPKIQRIPPRKRSTSGQTSDIKGEIGSFRLPEKRHPGFAPQLKPYLNRHYGEE